MAKSITRIISSAPSAEKEKELAEDEILEAAAKHKEAVLQLLELAGALKEAGLLEMANAFINNRHQIGVIGINQLNKSGAQNLIKNGMSAVQFLGSMEPGKLEALLGALCAGAEQAVRRPAADRKAGLWEMLKACGNPDIRASFGFFLSFLRGMGMYFRRSHS